MLNILFSCESDNGCLYNCDKCGSQCLTCDCNKSIACKYNCDKCEDVQIGDGDNCHNLGRNLSFPTLIFVCFTSSDYFCHSGIVCQSLVRSNFPNCD